MPLEETHLKGKLEELYALRGATDEDLERFGALLETLSDEALFRINPLSFAARHAISAKVAIDLFLYGVYIGLFDIHWRMVCVFCGAVEYVYDSLDKIPSTSFHCTPCDTDIECALDDRVEVTFTPSPAMGRLHVEPFRDVKAYRAHFTSSHILHAPKFAEYLKTAHLGECVLAPRDACEFNINLQIGQSARLVSYDRHVTAFVRAGEHADLTNRADFQVTESAISPAEILVRPGSCSIHVVNKLAESTGMLLLDGDVHRFEHLVTKHRSTRMPYFTAQMLLNRQTFRTLFRVQRVAPDLTLNIRNQTLLFTDLKGSTELYDRIGDVEAYQIVRTHFRELAAATAMHSGAIVKTIGDAVMATFSTAHEAVMAAIDMQHRIFALNRGDLPPGVQLGLRIGIHTGSVLMVNADDRLDYFGQTVNVAARVQGLAGANQICVTRTVFEAPGVAELLAAHDEGLDEPVSLRGIGLPTLVRRIAVRKPGDDV